MKNLKFVLLTLILLLSSNLLLSVDYTWSGGSGNWSDTGRWTSVPNTPGTYPDDAGDTATIQGTPDVTIDVALVTVASITLEDNSRIVTGANSLTVTGTVLGTGVDPSTNGEGYLDRRGRITSTGGTVTINDVDGISLIDVNGTTSINITTLTQLHNKLKVKDVGCTLTVGTITSLSKLELQDVNESNLSITTITSLLKVKLNAVTTTANPSNILSTTIPIPGTIADGEIKDSASNIILPAGTITGTLIVDASTIELSGTHNIGTLEFRGAYGPLDIEDKTLNITTQLISDATIHSGDYVYPNPVGTAGGNLSVKSLLGGKTLSLYGSFTDLTLTDADAIATTGANSLRVTGDTSGLGTITSTGGDNLLYNVVSLGLLDLANSDANIGGNITELKANNTPIYTFIDTVDPRIGLDLTVANISTWSGTSKINGPYYGGAGNTGGSLNLTTSIGPLTIDAQDMFNDVTLANDINLSTGANSFEVDGRITAAGSTISSTGGTVDIYEVASLDTLSVNTGSLNIGFDSTITNLDLTAITLSPTENLTTTNTTVNNSTINIASGKEYTVTTMFTDTNNDSTITGTGALINIEESTGAIGTVTLSTGSSFNITGSGVSTQINNFTSSSDSSIDIGDSALALSLTIGGTPQIVSSGGSLTATPAMTAGISGTFGTFIVNNPASSITYNDDVTFISSIITATIDANGYKTTFNGAGVSLNATSITLDDVLFYQAFSLNPGNDITLSGNWENRATTLTIGAGSDVTFTDSSKPSYILGSTSFTSFICNTDSKNLIFEAGSRQTISTTLDLQSSDRNNAINLASTVPGSQWEIDFTPNDGSEVTSNLFISDSNSISGVLNSCSFTTGDDYSYSGGNNTNWGGFTIANEWTGASSANWNDAGNWSMGLIPDNSAGQQGRPLIPTGLTRYPIVNSAGCQAGILLVAPGATVTIETGRALFINAFLRNQGTVRMTGTADINLYDSGNGTVEFYGTGGFTTANWASDFYNLKVTSSGTVTLNTTRIVNGNLDVESGTLDLGTNTITLKGDLTTHSSTGIDTSGSGSPFIIDGDTDVTGNAAFNAVTINAGRTLSLNDDISVSGNIVNDGVVLTNNKKVTFNGNSTLSSNLITFGDLEIGSGNTLILSQDIKVGGDWIYSTGTFTPGGKIVEFVSGIGPSTIYGDNTFDIFKCTAPGKTLYLESGKTQTVGAGGLTIVGSEASLITVTSSSFDKFILSAPAAVNVSIDYISVSNSTLLVNDVNAGYHSVDGGGNELTVSPKWIFPRDMYEWTGDTDTDWTVLTNWEMTSDRSNPTVLPDSADWVIIPTGRTNYPVISSTNVDLKNLNIATGASLEVAGTTALTSVYYNNDGTLKISGTATVDKTDTNSGTVEYVITGTRSIIDFGTTDYFNLKLSGSGTKNITADLRVAGSININEGTFENNNQDIYVSGDWYKSAGATFTLGGIDKTVYFEGSSTIHNSTTFQHLEVSNGASLSISADISVKDFNINGTVNAGSSTLQVNENWNNISGVFNRDSSTVEFINSGTAATITGSTVFNIFKCVTQNKTINFTAGTTQTFYDLEITGAAANLVVLKGATLANWNFKNLKGIDAQVSYVDVQYGLVDELGENIGASNSSFDANTDTIGDSNKTWLAITPQNATWLGNAGVTGNDWNLNTNWSTSLVPTGIDTVTIPSAPVSGKYPILDVDAEVFDLVVETGATLTAYDGATAFDLTINGSLDIQGTGKIVRTDAVAHSVTKTDTDSGTVEYISASANAIEFYSGVDYYNLVISDGAKSLSEDLELNGSFTISGGGSLNANSRKVTFTGAGNVSISGTPTFYDLTINKTNSGDTVTINSGITVSNNLTMSEGTLDLNNTANSVGNDVVLNSGILLSGNNTLTISGSWDNNGGTYTAQAGSTVLFNDNSKTSVVYGSNTFINFSCATAGKLIRFESGANQTVSNLTITGTANPSQIMLYSTVSNASWNLSAAASTVTHAKVRRSDLFGGADIFASGDSEDVDITCDIVTSDGTPKWVFGGLDFIWDGGGAAGSWNDILNWDIGAVPNDPAHNVTIPTTPTDNATNWPDLPSDIDVNDLTIENNAQLDALGYDLTIAGTITNNGILYRTGVGAQNISKIDSANGTVSYTGTAAGNVQYYAAGYNNLTIVDGDKTAQAGAIGIGGNLELTNSGAKFITGANNITVTGVTSGSGVLDSNGGDTVLNTGDIRASGLHANFTTANGMTIRTNSLTGATDSLDITTLQGVGSTIFLGTADVPTTTGGSLKIDALTAAIPRVSGKFNTLNIAIEVNTEGNNIDIETGSGTGYVNSSAGNFTLAAGTTFIKGIYTNVVVDGGTADCGTGGLSITNRISGLGTIKATSGTISVGENWQIKGYTYGTSLLKFTNAAASSITASSDGLFYDVQLEAGTLGTGRTITVANDLTLTDGTMSIAANNLTVNGDITGSATGILTSTGNSIIDLAGAWAVRVFNHGTSTVQIGSTQTLLATTDHQFFNLVIDGPSTLTAAIDITVLNDITIGDTLALGTNDLYLGRHRTVSSGSITGSGIVYWTGTEMLPVVSTFNFNTLTQDLIFSNAITLRTNQNILTAGNITFNSTVDGHGVDNNSLTVESTAAGKSIIFNGLVGNTNSVGSGAAVSPFDIDAETITVNSTQRIAVTAATATFTGNTTFNNSSIYSGSPLTFTGGTLGIVSANASETIQTTDTAKNLTFDGSVTTDKPLNCTASGNINLNNTITASPLASALILTAGGSIVDGTGTETAILITNNLTLDCSPGGAVGAIGAGDIDVDITTLVEGSSGAGGVYITQVADRDLGVTSINSANGNVTLINEAITAGNGDIVIDGASGGISADLTDDIVTISTINGEVKALNLTADTNVEITGFRIDISSNGSFGTSANQMDINAAGELNVSAIGSAWIYDRAGTLPLKTITVTTPSDTRISAVGDITQVAAGLVTTDDLVLTTAGAGNIGVSGTPILTNITNLEVISFGDLYLLETDNLNIGSVSAATGITTGGNMELDITGSGNTLTISEALNSSGTLSLYTTNGNITLNGTVTSTGNIDFNTDTLLGAITINQNITCSGNATLDINSGTALTTLNADISYTLNTGEDNKNITFASALEVTGTRTIGITNAAADLDVAFSNTVNNGNLTINAGIGYVDFNGLLGNTTPLTALTVGNANRVDFVGISGMTGNLGVTTPTTNGVILFEGDTYNVTGTIGVTAGDRLNAEPNRGGLFINAPLAMAISCGGFTANSNTTTYMYGATSANTVTMNGGYTFVDLHVSLPGKVLSFNSSVNVNNLVLYDGNLNLNGNNLIVTQDLVLLGAGYNDTDPDTTNAGVFSYDPSPTYTRQKAINSEILGSFLSGYDPTFTTTAPYSGIFSDLAGSTIQVGQNFYNNGCNMPGTGAWTLTLIDNDDATAAFAEAYNMTTQNSNANFSVAAAEGVTATTCTNWSATRPVLDTANSNIYTVYDDVIRVSLDNGLLFENDNNEIEQAIISGAIGISNNSITGIAPVTTSDLKAYTNPECTTLTSAGGTPSDLSVFYIRVENSAAYRWNTDATGLSAGTATSTDRGRTGVAPVNRTTVPNIDINKDTATVYFTLRDSNKNRIQHTVGVGRVTGVLDRCSPVIVSVEASNHGATGDTVDNHNYFEITYSEDVQYAANTVTLNSFAVNTRSSSIVLDTSGDQLGYISQSGPNVEVNGLFTYPGNYVSGSFDATPNANALFSADQKKLRIDVVGYNNGTSWPGYLGSTATNIANYTKITNPSATYIRGNFNSDLADLRSQHTDGDIITQLTDIAKSITVLSNPDITDTSGNVIEDSTSTYTDAYYKTSLNIIGTGWDVFPPFIARLSTTTAADPIYEAYFMDEKDAVGDRIVDNLSFVILDDHILQPYWNSLTGWTQGVPVGQQGIIPNPVGGIRDFYLAGTLALGNYQAFTYGLKDVGPFNSTPTIAGTTNVENNILSGYTTNIYTNNDGYFSIQFNPQGWILKDLMSVGYTSATGQITDLAGNLMPSSDGQIPAYQWIPPEIILTLAKVGETSLYVQFSKGVYGNLIGPRTGISSNSIIINNSETGNSITGVTSVNGISGMVGESEFYLTLATPLTANDMVTAQLKVNPASPVYDLAGTDIDVAYERRVSDLGIGLVTPVYAQDTIHQDNNLKSDGALRDFTGAGRLIPDDIQIAARIEGTANQSLGLSMFYDVSPNLSARYDYNPNDNVYNSDLWLPIGESIVGVYQYTTLNPRQLTTSTDINGLKLFAIPNSDSELTAGNELQFIFKLSTTPDPLYCVYNPGDELKLLSPWSIQLQEVRRQRGGVTILNNVINPLNGDKTELIIDQDKPGMSTIAVFALDGSIIKVLHSGRLSAGTYRYQWDGTNKSGTPVARGVYFVKVVAPGINESRKVMIVK